eukprot:289255-Chlamydomonas_euryale.AAC.3
MNALQACLSAAVLSAAGLVAVLAPGGGGGAASPPLSTNPLSAEAAALASFASSPGRRRGAGSAGGSSSAGGGGVGGSGAGVGGICEGSSRARPCDAGVLSRLRSMLPDVHQWLSGSLAAAGFELGVWQVMAFGLEMAGLEVISATRSTLCIRGTLGARGARGTHDNGGSGGTGDIGGTVGSGDIGGSGGTAGTAGTGGSGGTGGTGGTIDPRSTHGSGRYPQCLRHTRSQRLRVCSGAAMARTLHRAAVAT